jgi:hypothetical protein
MGAARAVLIGLCWSIGGGKLRDPAEPLIRPGSGAAGGRGHVAGRMSTCAVQARQGDDADCYDAATSR